MKKVLFLLPVMALVVGFLTCLKISAVGITIECGADGMPLNVPAEPGSGWHIDRGNGYLVIEKGYEAQFTGEKCKVVVDNQGTITNGDFSQHVRNRGVINNGIFTETINNENVISGGNFQNEVYNSGTINNGKFFGEVQNDGTITDGTFTGKTYIIGNQVYPFISNNGLISGGTFNEVGDNEWGMVSNDQKGLISGGTFNAAVDNNGVVSDGIFNKFVYNCVSYYVDSADYHSGKITGGTFNAKVSSDGNIGGGIFNETVENRDVIENGEFHGLVSNNGKIEGGELKEGASVYDFTGGKNEISMKCTATVEIDGVTIEYDENPVTGKSFKAVLVGENLPKAVKDTMGKAQGLSYNPETGELNVEKVKGSMNFAADNPPEETTAVSETTVAEETVPAVTEEIEKPAEDGINMTAVIIIVAIVVVAGIVVVLIIRKKKNK